MCGIFAFIKSQKKLKFDFNIFEDYVNSPFMTKRQDLLSDLMEQYNFQEYIETNNLYVEIDVLKVDQYLRNRGPDYQNAIEIQQPYYGYLYHSLLHMRGKSDEFVRQPVVNNQYILQYNGEIYNLGPDVSDTVFMMENLMKMKDYEQHLPQFLEQLNGDYSLIFHDLEQQKIVICKDPFGKRSLLLGIHREGFVLTSQVISEQTFEMQQDIEEEENDGKTVDDKYLMRKYLNEFNQSLNKQYYELPNNCVIIIDMAQEVARWSMLRIKQNYLAQLMPAIINQVDQQQITYDIYQLFLKSTQEIIQNIFGLQEHFLNKQVNNYTGRIGILFSGGIDCSLITHAVAKLLPPNTNIDLINVAFMEDAPDRKTSLVALQELQQLHPQQIFNLIKVDKTLEDVQEQEKQLLQLIYPKITHMDFNIAVILSIASSHYTQSRVLLSGLGADEIFSGYARYKHALKRGEQELLEEMNFDLLRLWVRNLGRDDRAVSSNGKELRFPFLNLNLIEYVRSHVRPDQYQQGSTKTILRTICQLEGLQQISLHDKKAIQFGTKIAKLSNKRFFGGNKKAKGTANYKV